MYNIKKWIKMVTGKSIYHVNQGEGKLFSKEEIKGYYNDLTEKVLKSTVDINEIPRMKIESGEIIEFSIGIFQYGLGAYDLYLLNHEKEMLQRFKMAAEWAISHQENNGGWVTFNEQSNTNPYSSMAQGEGISLLLRAFVEFKDIRFKEAAKKAMDFMQISIEKNGTTKYYESDIYLQEFPNKPTVLNGWIFSIFGIMDYMKIYKDDLKVREFYEKSLKTLIKVLPEYDINYWSKYDIKSKIASPFYHKLHINLLKVMYKLTGHEIFQDYANKFEEYSKKRLNRIKAFVIKAYQKIKEK